MANTILEAPIHNLHASAAKAETARRLFSDRTYRIGSENAFRIGPQIAELERQGHKVIKCNLGEPDFPLAKHIADEIKRQIDLDLTHYCDPQGILPLREAIARIVSRTRQIEVSPDRVVVFPGGKPPIGLTQQTYCNPGDEVIYPSPGFPIYESFTGYIGAKPVPLHLREEADFSFSGRDLAPLITDRTRVIILNFPSNPTGGVATREQLEEIADVIHAKAPEERAHLFGRNLRRHFVRRQSAPLDRVDPDDGGTDDHRGRRLEVVRLDRRAGRLGGVSDAEEAAVFKNLNINYFSCIPAYNQMGAVVALESPQSAVEIARMCDAFRERRDVMVAGLNAIPGIRCRKPGGAFYLFPNISGMCETLGAIEAHYADARRRTARAAARRRSCRCSCSGAIRWRRWTAAPSAASARKGSIISASRSRPRSTI